MPRHRDGFLLSSWPDNPLINVVLGIRREEEKEENSKYGKMGGKEHPLEKPRERGGCGQRQPIHPACSTLPGLGMNGIYCPLK